MNKLKILLLCALIISSVVYADTANFKSNEIKRVIEDLSGLGILKIEQRYSDGDQLKVAQDYLIDNYKAQNIFTEIKTYNPLDVFPEYYKGIDQTYRNYFKHLTAKLTEDYENFCQNKMDSLEAQKLSKRLKKVEIDETQFCALLKEKRVDYYVTKVVDFSTGLTKTNLAQRKKDHWSNLVAYLDDPKTIFAEDNKKPLCVIGAHLDSIERDGSRGEAVLDKMHAPGADDNASGSAAIYLLALELKKQLKDEKITTKCDLAFVHFSGEEEGLFGSLAYASKQASKNILFMVNFDMIAYHPKDSKKIMNIGYKNNLGDKLVDAFTKDQTIIETIAVESETFTYSSDQISFWQNSIPALAISEASCTNEKCNPMFENFNPYLHTANDSVEQLDFDYAAMIIEQSLKAIKLLVSIDKLNQPNGPEVAPLK